MIQELLTVVERARGILIRLVEAGEDKGVSNEEFKDFFAATRHHLDNAFEFEEPEFDVPSEEFYWWDVGVVRPLEYGVGDFSEEYAIPNNDRLWRARAITCAEVSLNSVNMLFAELDNAMRVADSRRLRGIKYAPATIIPKE